jgi:hypothetical protein
MNRGWEYRSALPSCLRFAFSRHEAEFCSHAKDYTLGRAMSWSGWPLRLISVTNEEMGC